MANQERKRVLRPLKVLKNLVSAREGAEDVHEASATLERTLQDVYRKVEAQPEKYLMSKEEYAVLNYFQDRWKDSRLFQQAVFRFWKNYEAPPKAATLSTTSPEVPTEDVPDMPPPGYLGPNSMSKVLQTSLQGWLLCSRFSLTRPGRC